MMRIFLLLLFPIVAWGVETPEQQLIRQTIAVMTPVHTQWMEESRKFSESAQAFCDKGKELGALRQQWRNTQQSWSELNAFSIGPLTENGYLSMQVQYWPDKKNLVEFQMRDALRQYRDAVNVMQLSVALRGLSASEFILFDASVNLDKPEERQRYCPMLLSVANYQQTLSQQVQLEWQQYLPTLTLPSDRFITSHDVLTDWLRVQVSALEMQHKKLALPLGTLVQEKIPPGKNTAQPYLAEYWRSAQSLASLRAAISIHRQVWQQGWRPLILPLDKTLALNIDETFDRIEKQLDPLKSPMPDLLRNEAGVNSLRNLYVLLDELRSHYETSVAKTLNIQIGFNANDGD